MSNYPTPNKLQIKKISSKYGIHASFIESLSPWFGIKELTKILAMEPGELRKTIRVNLLKTTRDEVIDRLHEENIIAKPLGNIPEGLNVVSGKNKIGSSLTYLAGEIMPQGLGSMLSVIAMDPQPGERILEMASAPGGKSCFIGERMKGKGLLITNDKSHTRMKSLILNLARHKITNSVVINEDASNLNFLNLDKIMLDAPCSGDGLVVSKPFQRHNKNSFNSYQMQPVQINLLSHAITMLKINGECIYSTCSLNPFENEMVVKTVLKDVNIINIQIDGNPGFSSINNEFTKAKRLLPTTNKCDGFFIVKLRKKS